MRVPIQRTNPPSGKRPHNWREGACNGANARSRSDSCDSNAIVDDDNPGQPTICVDTDVVNGRIHTSELICVGGSDNATDSSGWGVVDASALSPRRARNGSCAADGVNAASSTALQQMTVSKRRKGITANDNVIEDANIDDTSRINKLSSDCTVFTRRFNVTRRMIVNEDH